MNYNILVFALLAILFIVIITLSIKLSGLRRNRLLPCVNNTKVNIINEYQENLNDIPFTTPTSLKPKKIKFNNNVKVRVFG